MNCRHINRIQIRTFLTINFNIDEKFIHNIGHVFIFNDLFGEVSRRAFVEQFESDDSARESHGGEDDHVRDGVTKTLRMPCGCGRSDDFLCEQRRCGEQDEEEQETRDRVWFHVRD